MIIWLITEFDEKTKQLIVSHGVNDETGQNIVLPWMPVNYFQGAKYSNDAGMYYINEEK